MPKHTIDISAETNNKIKLWRMKYKDLKNVSDVLDRVIGMSDPDGDDNSWQGTYRQNGVTVP